MKKMIHNPPFQDSDDRTRAWKALSDCARAVLVEVYAREQEQRKLAARAQQYSKNAGQVLCDQGSELWYSLKGKDFTLRRDTIEKLAHQQLITTWRDHRGELCQLTPFGRATVRKNDERVRIEHAEYLAHQKRLRELARTGFSPLSYWLWLALVEVFKAGALGLPRAKSGQFGSKSWGTWVRLRNRKAGAFVAEDYRRVEPAERNETGGYVCTYWLVITPDGRRHVETFREQYKTLYNFDAFTQAGVRDAA